MGIAATNQVAVLDFDTCSRTKAPSRFYKFTIVFCCAFLLCALLQICSRDLVLYAVLIGWVRVPEKGTTHNGTSGWYWTDFWFFFQICPSLWFGLMMASGFQENFFLRILDGLTIILIHLFWIPKCCLKHLKDWKYRGEIPLFSMAKCLLTFPLKKLHKKELHAIRSLDSDWN